MWNRLLEALRWASLRDKLRTSLWLTPVAYTGLAGLMAAALLQLDRRRSSDASAWFLYGGQADGARELLSTIASSMLTIAGLVFSITILVLQLASSQFSPRVLRTFLRDTVTQRAMGTFLGSFVYAMVLLPEVRSETEGSPAFVPGLSVYVAFVLVLISVALFVRYIHHMAHAVRAVNIMKRVAEETHDAIHRLYPGQFLEGPARADPALPDVASATVVGANRAGVVISVDERALMRAALSDDLVIAVIPAIGDFVPRGAPLCRVWGAAKEAKLSVDGWIILSDERTPHQDAIFGFRQLVDIAERALSPGTNDPTTAVQALDQLHDLLRALAHREIPSPVRVDEQGRLRLVLPRPDWSDYVQLSFEEIRMYGAESVQVVRRMRTALNDLLAVTGPARAQALRTELALLEAAKLHARAGQPA